MDALRIRVWNPTPWSSVEPSITFLCCLRQDAAVDYMRREDGNPATVTVFDWHDDWTPDHRERMLAVVNEVAERIVARVETEWCAVSREDVHELIDVARIDHFFEEGAKAEKWIEEHNRLTEQRRRTISESIAEAFDVWRFDQIDGGTFAIYGSPADKLIRNCCADDPMRRCVPCFFTDEGAQHELTKELLRRRFKMTVAPALVTEHRMTFVVWACELRAPRSGRVFKGSAHSAGQAIVEAADDFLTAGLRIPERTNKAG